MAPRLRLCLCHCEVKYMMNYYQDKPPVVGAPPPSGKLFHGQVKSALDFGD